LSFTDPAQSRLEHCNVVFFATPHGVAMRDARRLVDAGVRVIDLAADFRLRDLDEWKHWYKLDHTAPDLVSEAVYGVPEINRAAIRSARVVANPGCYATTVQLGLLPLVERELVDLEHLVADAKSGVSGAGRKAELSILFSEASDNFAAYGVAGHRHAPEIRESLGRVAGRPIGLVFVPHLTPMIRGIHATLYARIVREADFQAVYEERFKGEPFVDVLPGGRHPDTRSVRASNVCRIAVHRPQGGDTLVVLAVLDNLVKGAAGQAVQNMNVMFGIDETAGLTQLPVVP
jgi:N-acetyl-gamma-glutamyl-phosphate reductase